VACLAGNNAVTAMENHWIKVHNMPLANKVNLGNTRMNIIRLKGMVTLLHSSHIQALHNFITSLHSPFHTVRNQPAVQAKDFQVMGHHGKNMTYTKVVMAGLICSLLRSSQDTGRHVQVHPDYLLDSEEIMQSICRHVTARLLHLNLSPAHLADTL
jgi:hypothetical protein